MEELEEMEEVPPELMIEYCDSQLENIERQREKLIEIIESEFGLLEKLLKFGAIIYPKYEQIHCDTNRRKVNAMILEDISQRNTHREFIAALMESSQTHVVNWILSNGECRSEFGLEWPLTASEIENLNVNQEELVDLLDTSELLCILYSKQVINTRQRDAIESQSISARRNQVLLGIIRRLSRKSYLTVTNCLRESNQSHVADIMEHIGFLENGGIIVRVRVILKNENLDETKKEISEKMTSLLTNQEMDTDDEAYGLLSALQLKIVGVKCGDSVALFVCCSMAEEFDQLCKFVDDIEMKDILEQLFNLLLHDTNVEIHSVNILERDMMKARQSFQRNERRGAKAPPVATPKITTKKSKKREENSRQFATVHGRIERLKIVLIGDGATGKTCLVSVFATDQFPAEYIPTIFDNYARFFEVDGKLVDVAFWDTAGQSDYDRLRPLSYPGTDVFLFCFSFGSHESLETISEKWLPEVRSHCPDVPLVLVGNKKDLKDDVDHRRPIVSHEEGEAKAKEIGAAAYVACSALTKEGVRELLELAVRVYLKRKRKMSKRNGKRCVIV